jgi:hypothetical protein
VSNKWETTRDVVRLAARVRTLLMVGVLGALITVVFGATLESVHRSEPPPPPSQLESGGVSTVERTDALRPARVASAETLYLLLLGAALLCIAAGLKAVAPEGGAASERGDRRAITEHLEPTAAIRAASATSTTR